MDTNNNILDDCITRTIGEYIKDNLNVANPIANTIIINSIRNYDAFNVPVQDYPLLKVSRIRSSHITNDRVTSNIALDFCVLLADLEKIAAYTKWIDFRTNELLAYIVHERNIFVHKGSRNSDYRITMVELQPVILRILRITFNIHEGNY